jgi:hypothetical protein
MYFMIWAIQNIPQCYSLRLIYPVDYAWAQVIVKGYGTWILPRNSSLHRMVDSLPELKRLTLCVTLANIEPEELLLIPARMAMKKGEQYIGAREWEDNMMRALVPRVKELKFEYLRCWNGEEEREACCIEGATASDYIHKRAE